MNYQILENACGDSPFFFGHALTILDIYIWMFVNWSEDLDGLRELCPKVVKIAENVMKRPKITPIHVTNFGQGLGWSAV